MGSFLEIFKDKRNRSIFLIVACLIVIALFFIFRFNSNTGRNLPLNAVPPDAVMIVEVKQAGELWEELSTKSGVWQELLNFNLFAEADRQILFLDSVFAANDCTSGILKDHSVYISFHILESGDAGIIYLTALPEKCSNAEAESMVKDAAGENITISEKEFFGENMSEVHLTDPDRSFYYVISNGVFIISFESALVADALMQQRSDKPLSQNMSFSKVQSTAGKKVQANLYINFNKLPDFIEILANEKTSSLISELTGFAGWSALDVSIKNDALLFNGFATADTAGGYLNLFDGQSPQEIEITSAIPASAAAFLAYGFSNFETWYASYKTYLERKGRLEQYNAKLAELNRKYDTDVEKEITTWLGNEMAVVITEPSDTGFSENMFLVIKADNIENASTLLKKNSLSVEKKIVTPKKTSKTKKSKNKKSKAKTVDVTEESAITEKLTEIKDNTIYEYKVTGVFPALFGGAFKGINGKYYVIEDNYVIFGNTLSAIKSYIKDYNAEKILENSNSYQAFSKNVSAESNLYLYCNVRKSLGIFMKYANDNISGYIGENLSLFKNFDALAFQLKSSNDMFYCNLCLRTNTVIVSESNALWSVELDSTVIGRPLIVSDTAGKPRNIVAFDIANNMYLINAKGEIKWKLNLKERPLGEVELIDCDKNNKYQYLFNTESYLYMVDSDGSFHTKFPVKFDEPSTAPLTLVDYSKNKDYRIIVPCGREVYNFQKDGTLTKGWSIVKTKSNLITKVSYLKFNGTDCYAVTDKTGNIYLFNRKGEEFIELKETPWAAPFSKFYVKASAGKQDASIITSDLKGNLLSITSKGTINKTVVPDLSAQHFFFYVDFNDDKKKEYVFIDKTKLSIYSADMKLINSYTFPSDIIISPEYFEDVAGKNFMGVFCSKVQKIYVIDKECTIKEGYPMEATTMFTIGSLNSDDTYNLLFGNGSTIYNYSFE